MQISVTSIVENFIKIHPSVCAAALQHTHIHTAGDTKCCNTKLICCDCPRVFVCLYARLCICMSVCQSVCVSSKGQTDGSFLMKFSKKNLTYNFFAGLVFLGFRYFKNDDVMVVGLNCFKLSTHMVAIMLLLFSKLQTR